MEDDRAHNSVKETLIKRLALDNKKFETIKQQSRKKLENLLSEYGREKFLDNPDWVIEIAIDGVLAEWFKSKTHDLREKDGYSEALSSRDVQSLIRQYNERLHINLKEYVFVPGHNDVIKHRSSAPVADDLGELIKNMEGMFMKICETFNHIDTRLRALEKACEEKK